MFSADMYLCEGERCIKARLSFGAFFFYYEHIPMIFSDDCRNMYVNSIELVSIYSYSMKHPSSATQNYASPFILCIYLEYFIISVLEPYKESKVYD